MYVHHDGDNDGASSSVVVQMLRHIVEAQEAEARWHLAERSRDMTAEQDLRALAAATNDATNRLAASASGIESDLDALKTIIESGTVTPEAIALVTGAMSNVGAMASALEAIDSAFPVATPTPTPEPDEPTEVPPVDEMPGTEPIPTDGSGGGGDGSVPPITGPTDNPADPSNPV